jgi:periplasmic divalent cation tolerance protein
VEIRLEMKTKRSLFENIQTEIEHLHTYEVPEIIMVPMAGANSPYLQWIEKETSNT